MTRSQTVVAEPIKIPLPVLTDGGTIVCLGTGPSLTAEDVEYCKGRAHVVALNDAWRLAPWADVLYSSDPDWYPFHHWVPAYHGIKVALDHDGFISLKSTAGIEWNSARLRQDGIILLKCTGEIGVDWNRSGLRTKNTGGAAINLAVHLGAKRIVLLGYDMGADYKQSNHHFFGRHPFPLRTTSAGTFIYFRTVIQTMAQPLLARGITVINASRRTLLDCFQKKTLAQALQ